MNKQFTASEVRELVSKYEDQWIPVELTGPAPSEAKRLAIMLHAYADRLEADEKAVPVAWRIRVGSSNVWGYCESEHDADFLGEQSGLRYEKQPLYTHSAPSNTERLAEALRVLDDTIIFVTKVATIIHATGSECDESEAIRRLTHARDELRAAHSAPAQPPAARVTDAMVERACKKYAFREDGATFPDAYSDEEVLAERVLMREFLEHVLLAAQENPND